MNASRDCPTQRDFENLLLGRLPEDLATTLERHLDDCTACTEVLAGLRVESRLLRALQDSRSPRPEAAPGLEELMSQLEQLCPSQLSQGLSHDGPHAEEENFSFLAPPQGPDEMGRLGPYRVLRLLGAGGMGFVFLAEDPLLNRQVALKVLRQRTLRHPAAHDRFLREARAMAALKHDNVAALFQVGEVPLPDALPGMPGMPYLAMELLEGERLLEWMRAHPRPPIAWVIRIGRQAAEGLAAAHASGLIHRDVKPGNLWLEAPAGWRYDPPLDRPSLGEVGRVKLFDFGLAFQLGEATPGAFLGTPAYGSPEQLCCRPVDGRSDLFSLGCVLYELCTGAQPFPDRQLDLAGRLAFVPPPPSIQSNPRVPAPLSGLIERLLAEDPADRPASAREVERALATLERAIEQAGVTQVANDTLPLGDPVPVRRVPRPRRRWQLWGAVALVGALAGTLVGVPLLWSAGQRHEKVEPQRAPAPKGIAARPPFPLGPPDEEWDRKLAELPTQQQYRIVGRKLEELNPGYSHQDAAGWIETEAVLRFSVRTDAIHDIRPIGALTDVKTLRVSGSAPGKGQVTDLSPLANLKLKRFYAAYNPGLRDLSPLRGMLLDLLDLAGTGVESLADLEGCPVQQLILDHTAVRDLRLLETMPRLRVLSLVGCPVVSTEPLARTALHEVKLDYQPGRDAAVLGRLSSLEKINGQPARQFLQQHPLNGQ